MDLPEVEMPSFIKSTWGGFKSAVIGCSAAVLLGLMILAVSLVSVNSGPRAAEENMPSPESTPSASTVEYYLPYPGILPDSPLYRLKAIRDRIRLWSTFDELKKAEVELELADKRLNAAVALIEGGKGSLGVSTATKGEKYLEQSASRAIGLLDSGVDSKSLLLSLTNATLKHLEILELLISSTNGADSEELQKVRGTTQMISEQIAQALLE